MARAIAICWRWPPDIAPTWAVHERTVAPSSANAAPAGAMAFSSMKPELPEDPLRGISAEEHVLHRVEVRGQGQVLVDHLDPEGRGVLGVAMSTGWPSKSISPESTARLPESALTSVDLPAPLSPMRATTSPG